MPMAHAPFPMSPATAAPEDLSTTVVPFAQVLVVARCAAAIGKRTSQHVKGLFWKTLVT